MNITARRTLLLSTAFFILAFFAGRNADAQHVTLDQNYKSILLIPFQPGMFQTDINMTAVEKNEKKSPFSKWFSRSPKRQSPSNYVRHSLDKTLFDNLLLYFDIKRILYYDNKVSRADLDYIYESIYYEINNKNLTGYYKNFPRFSVFQILGPAKARYGVNCLSDPSNKPLPKNHKLLFTDVVIQDSNLIPHLNKRYQCNYYLFINYVELKTRFKACMNLMNNIYQKDIVVHYTLYAANGEKELGGLVGITYEPKENNVVEIIEENFGILAGLIVEQVRDSLREPLRVEVF